MDEEKQVVTITRQEGINLAVLESPKVLDEVSISEIGDKLSTIAKDTEFPKLVVDFRNVSNMSSSALGMLITVHKRIREAGGQLRLCNINPNIAEVFSITRLDEIFIIDKELEDSIAQLK